MLLAVEAKNLKKTFKTKQGNVEAVRDVSFKVNKGEIITGEKRRINKPKITLVRICKDIQECDIDEVAKKIFQAGKVKKFPDLTIK